MNEYALVIENLYMKYNSKDKQFVLENLNFKIKKGDFHAFIGENGAGKSTTIKIISGLNNEYDGNVYINNLNVKDDVKARESFSYILDSLLLQQCYRRIAKEVMNPGVKLDNDLVLSTSSDAVYDSEQNIIDNVLRTIIIEKSENYMYYQNDDNTYSLIKNETNFIFDLN